MRRNSSTGLKDLVTMEKPWEKYRTVWTDPSGQYDVVAVETQWDYGLEGYFLAHCLGTKDFDEFNRDHIAYSLRDSLKVPHATILCLRDDGWSVYSRAADLGTTAFFTPEPGIRARVLQVRGREDTLAALPFHRLIRDWYLARGGKLVVQPKRLDEWCRSKMADDDTNYHYSYLLDESVNFFNWAHHNSTRREAYIPH